MVQIYLANNYREGLKTEDTSGTIISSSYVNGESGLVGYQEGTLLVRVRTARRNGSPGMEKDLLFKPSDNLDPEEIITSIGKRRGEPSSLENKAVCITTQMDVPVGITG